MSLLIEWINYIKWQELVFYLFILTNLIHLYFILRYFLRLATYSPGHKSSTFSEPVSIIVAAKDEEENLKQNLPLWLDQDYPQYEIVIVNDHSSDQTEAVVKNLKSERIRIVNLEGKKGKKAAVRKGIKSAKNKHYIFTDADCKPASTEWLKLMVEKFDQGELILGYGRYERKKGYLNSLIRYETLLNAIQYFSFAISGKAYMGVGRNLAYSEVVFKGSKKFIEHESIRSGDDDLLVNEMGAQKRVVIALDQKSHTFSDAKSSWKKYFYQKRRHLEAGTRYKMEDRFRLAILGSSSLLAWITFLLLLSISYNTWSILTIFAAKQLIQMLIFRKIMQKLGDRDLLILLPLHELVYLITVSLIGISTWIWKVDRWK